MRRTVLPLLLIAVMPLCATAQAVRDTLAIHVSPAIGIHYGVPMRLSLALGGLFDLRGRRNDGIVAMAEPGQGGTELSIGYFKRHRFGQGYSLRFAGIRTGEEPWNATPHTTYLGAELHWMIFLGVGGRVGWLRRVSTASLTGARNNLFTVGASIGD